MALRDIVEALELEHFQLTLELNRAFAIHSDGYLPPDLMPKVTRLNEVNKELDLLHMITGKNAQTVDTTYNPN